MAEGGEATILEEDTTPSDHPVGHSINPTDSFDTMANRILHRLSTMGKPEEYGRGKEKENKENSGQDEIPSGQDENPSGQDGNDSRQDEDPSGQDKKSTGHDKEKDEGDGTGEEKETSGAGMTDKLKEAGEKVLSGAGKLMGSIGQPGYPGAYGYGGYGGYGGYPGGYGGLPPGYPMAPYPGTLPPNSPLTRGSLVPGRPPFPQPGGASGGFPSPYGPSPYGPSPYGPPPFGPSPYGPYFPPGAGGIPGAGGMPGAGGIPSIVIQESVLDDTDSQPVYPFFTPETAMAAMKPKDYSCSVKVGEKNKLHRLGLGKAIDATNPHPWASKSTYQAKQIHKVDDLAVLNEGHHVKNFVEVVQNYFDVQGSLQGSLLMPSTPIEMGVAVDTHRSFNETRIIRGKDISTRTISFKVVTEKSLKGEAPKSTFEQQLERFVEREKTKPLEGHPVRNDIQLCYDFLNTLGGVTHYVSSITLGAMEYTVKKISDAAAGSKIGTSAKAGPFAGLSGRFGMQKWDRKAVKNAEKIGRILPNDNVQVHSQDEAVIRYAFTPLTNLVSNTELRGHLYKAIQYYIKTRLAGTNGPYHIVTPECTSKGDHIYWRVVEFRDEGETKYVVRCTTKLEEAANFYIRPDYTSLGQYFFITTYDDSESFKQRIERNANGIQKSADKHDKDKQKEKPRGWGKPEEQAKPTPRAEKPREEAKPRGEAKPSEEEKPRGEAKPREEAKPSKEEKPRGEAKPREEVKPSKEVKPREKAKPSGEQGAEEQPTGEEVLKVERYVHFTTQGSIFTYFRGGQVILEATGAVNPKTARFELIDRRDHESKPVIETDWIPDDDTPEGQPFFIRPHLHFAHCIGIAGFNQAEDPYYFCLKKKSRHQEGKCHMLFQLIPSRNADPHSIFFAQDI